MLSKEVCHTLKASRGLVVGIVIVLVLISMWLLVGFFLREPSNNVAICDSRFHFDEFQQIGSHQLPTKSVADDFLSKMLDLNGRNAGAVGTEQFCATAIDQQDQCIQYFQPNASAGGDVRICVNAKAKALVSVDFGE